MNEKATWTACDIALYAMLAAALIAFLITVLQGC